LITQNDIDTGKVHVGSRLFYARKDGTRIYGVVRAIYAEKKMLSLKPDESIKSKYPQTYRFRRLYAETMDMFGTQVAPLVLLASKGKYKKVFAVKEGLMATSGDKCFVERVYGLPDGYMMQMIDGVNLFDVGMDAIKAMVFPVTMVRQMVGLKAVEDYYKASQSFLSQAKINVYQKDFNRAVKNIEYSGGYYTKHSDTIEICVDGGQVNYVAYDKNDMIYDQGRLIDGVVKVIGTAKVKCLLIDLKELTRGIRTKEYGLELHRNKMMKIETVEQIRYLVSR